MSDHSRMPAAVRLLRVEPPAGCFDDVPYNLHHVKLVNEDVNDHSGAASSHHDKHNHTGASKNDDIHRCGYRHHHFYAASVDPLSRGNAVDHQWHVWQHDDVCRVELRELLLSLLLVRIVG